MTKEEILEYLSDFPFNEKVAMANDIDYSVAVREIIYYHFLPEEFDTGEDQENFIQVLNTLTDANRLIEVVESVKKLPDTEKWKIYNNIKENASNFLIFFCLEDDLLKETFIKEQFSTVEIEESFYLSELIEEIKSEEITIRLYNDYEEQLPDYEKANVLIKVSDEAKIELARKSNLHEGALRKVLNSLKDDDAKINAILHGGFDLDEYEMTQIIFSFDSDEKKLECLNNKMVTTGSFVTTILKSFLEDEKKEEYLKSPTRPYLDEEYIAAVVETYESDDLKKQAIDYYKIERNRWSVATSFKESKNVVEFLKEYLSIDYYKVLGYLVHLERRDSLQIYEELFPSVLSGLSSKFGISETNLDKVAQKYGYDIIKYLENDTIKKLINGPMEDLDTIYSLIDSPKMTMDDVNNVYNCLLQKRFSIQKPEIINIFSNINTAIDEKNFAVINNNIQRILDNNDMLKLLIDQNFISILQNSGYMIPTNKDEFESFLNKLCTDMLKEEKGQDSLREILHTVTNHYIRAERESYVANGLEHIEENLILQTITNKEKQQKAIFEQLNIEEITPLIEKLDQTKIQDEEIRYLLSPYGKKIINACIEFKKSPSTYQNSEITRLELTKKYLKMFNSVMLECYNQGVLKGVCEEDAIELTIDHQNKKEFYSLLADLDYDMLQDKLLSDPTKIEKLKNILDSCKVFDWEDTFDLILSDVGLETVTSQGAGLINYGYKLIIEVEQQGKLTTPMLLNFMNLYGSTSYLNKLLFEQENFNFISNNPGPNSAIMKKEERIQKLIDCYRKMYEKETLTVPTLEKEYTVDNAKKIKVVLGDVTSPINMTYGERTGACMRKGGAGDTLFDFCLTNESGFHIRFEDPKTGQFISRVSGFRNGNTIFLNQLRGSEHQDYISEDLIVALEQASKQLIETSKTSEYPIDNVVISKDYSMSSRASKLIPLRVSNIKEGLPYFYTDISRDGILLASSSGRSVVPIKLSQDLPKYEPLRTPVKKNLDNEKANEAVNHVKLVESMLLGQSLEKTELIENATISFTGQDWYIYIDKSNQLHSKVIDGISKKQIEAATVEMDRYIDTVSKIFSVEQKGVITNGK